MPKNLRFSDLPAIMATRLGQPGMATAKGIPNAESALGSLVRAVDLRMDAKIGTTLRDGFGAAIDRLREELLRAGLKTETVNNQVSLLNKWHGLVRALDHEGAELANGPTPFQKKLDGLFTKHGAGAWAFFRKAGIAPSTVNNWRKFAAVPKLTSDAALERLAVATGDVAGAFSRLLPPAVGRRKPVDVSKIVQVEHRERHKEMIAVENRYGLRPHEVYQVDPPSREVIVRQPLYDEWRGFVEHKVPLARVIRKALNEARVDRIAKPSVVNKIAATAGPQHGKPSILDKIHAAKQEEPDTKGKTWRLRPIEDYPSQYPAWVNCVGESIAPTADINFSYVSGYLGWLRLSPTRGGMGIPIEDLSMGHLVNTSLLDEFIDWRGVRSNAVNSGLLNMLRTVRSLTVADTGYLWSSAAIGKRMGYEPVVWREKCFEVHTWLYQRLGQLFTIAETSRDPAVPLKPLLDMVRPLQGFKDAINAFARENRCGYTRSTQARDLALLAISISNPLRLANLRMLTYKPDNTGHIRKVAGGWECFVPRIEFKNIRGAAKDRDYCQPLSAMAAKYFEQYIEGPWQALGGGAPGDRGLLFIARGKPNTVWKYLAAAYGNVTRRWLASTGCPALRTHATRYLVGTAIIMATKGDAELAAGALHDKRRTVENHYKKLLDTYTSRGIHAAIGMDMGVDDDMIGLVEIPDRTSLSPVVS